MKEGRYTADGQPDVVVLDAQNYTGRMDDGLKGRPLSHLIRLAIAETLFRVILNVLPPPEDVEFSVWLLRDSWMTRRDPEAAKRALRGPKHAGSIE